MFMCVVTPDTLWSPGGVAGVADFEMGDETSPGK